MADLVLTAGLAPLFGVFTEYPAYAAGTLRYSQSQIYQRYLGGIDGMPSEYLNIKTDYYAVLVQWCRPLPTPPTSQSSTSTPANSLGRRLLEVQC